MIVRRLGPGDEQIAGDLVNNVRLADYGQKVADLGYMADFLADERVYLVAACDDDGTPLGFVLGYRMPRIDGRPDMMYVHEVEVIKSRRGQGIGKAIMNEMIRICREEGLLKMFLGTDKGNLPANMLYTSTGGVPGDGDPIGYWWNFGG